MFEIGDKVVYPIHGAGIIVDVEIKEVLGEHREYYILQMPINDMKVMIPVGNMKEVGVREIMDQEEMDEVMEVLRNDPPSNMPKNWNRRYRFNMERIKSGDLKEIARVIKNLELLDAQKSLSTGERKLLNNAKQILVSEMVLVYDKSVEEVTTGILDAILD
ncbi:MAG: CarD family transcriptional regulator [Tissierellia bacterium]|nr:CarD family transcriptional regulator [Tissierellia bacterium]